MSILDRVTKAVGDVVDRGKKEVDQFVRIQKINSQIGDLDRKISESKDQIQQTQLKIGEMAIEMLRAGTLASQEMKALLDQITGIEQQIASVAAEISQKRAEIESIKSDDKAAKAPGPAAEEPAAPPSQPAAQPAADRACPQCGAPAGSGAFCGQCGSKLA
jgi:chromosome segregation ATPase